MKSNTLVFKANLRVDVIPGEGVLVLSEDSANALHGALHEQLAPLLDGSRDADAIVDALEGKADAAEVYYALALLEKNGYLTEYAPEIAPETAAFWHSAGIAPRAAMQALQSKRVRVRAVGDVDARSLRLALEESGIMLSESDEAALEVVVTDDYLRPALDGINDAALSSGRPWLLVKPEGAELWLGPLFVPARTGCHRCLAQRLTRNRLVHRFVADKKKLPGPPPTSLAAIPATRSAACAMAAIEVAKFLVAGTGPLEGMVISLDTRTWATVNHVLSKHPGCAACGEQADEKPAPLVLVARKVTFTRDGGHRSATPEQTLQKYQHLVSPITGVVKMLFPVHRAEGIAHVYIAGHNSAFRMERLDFLQHSLRNISSGKGMSEAQAKTSALCEAIERYSGDFTGSEYRISASYRELGADAIHPNDVMRFSDTQYAQRDIWNARKSKFNGVTERLDEDARIDWTPVWSLTEARQKYLPTQLVYYRARAGAGCERDFCRGCSNGNASGNNLEEAVLQGFYELVERDAVALWWYNRLPKQGVAIDSFGEPNLLALTAWYAAAGREIWALDITSDLGIPTFVAVSRLRGQPQERILFGLGCHLDARIALQRAFAEVNQMLGVAEGNEDGRLAIEDAETLAWFDHANLANQPYLAPDARLPLKRRDDYPLQHGDDLLADIHLCRRLVEERGMEMLVLDQTRPDVKMPVVKVIVPGLRHFWARYAPGRLYDVPVQMGWLDRPLTEEELNPIPVFF